MAEQPPMIGDMQQPGPRGRPSSSGAARSRAREQPADDWLGDISDYDWSEHAAEHDERDDATTSREGLVAVADDTGRPTSGAVDAAEARRAVVERRRIVAGLVIAAVLGVVIVVALVLLRGGSETAVTPPATTSPRPLPRRPLRRRRRRRRRRPRRRRRNRRRTPRPRRRPRRPAPRPSRCPRGRSSGSARVTPGWSASFSSPWSPPGTTPVPPTAPLGPPRRRP